MRRLIGLLLLPPFVLACGKNHNSTTTPSPTPTAPTTVSLAISPGTDFLKIRSTERFTVTATLSDGTTQVVQGTWGSDTPAVATVASDGTVTGAGTGDVTVFVDYQNVRTTRRIHVVPDYDGTWFATYRVMSCAEELDWRGICESETDTSTFWELDTTLHQDRLTVTGTVQPYSDVDPIPISGSIDAGGHFKATGSLQLTDDNGFEWLFEVLDFDALSTDSLNLAGHFTLKHSSPEYQGSFSLPSELKGSRSTATTTGGIRAGARPGGRLRTFAPPTLLRRP